MIIFVGFYFINAMYASIFIFKNRIYSKHKAYFIFIEMMSVCILMHGIFFFQYIFSLLKKQFQFILTNRTEVETVKKLRGAKIGKKASLRKVFGSLLFLYLFPIYHKGNSNYFEETYHEDVFNNQ